jgi:transposase
MKDWLPKGDLAWFLIDVADSLDLSEIYRHYEVAAPADGQALRSKARSGQPPFHPKVMVAVLLYAYCLGTPSSRKIARLCERDIGYRVVSADQQPNFRTISEFRRIHLKSLQGLFVQVLHLAREAGLVKLGHVALDGTKVKANASKHKAMSYARMCEKQAQYEKEVAEHLRRAQETDEAEDREYGRDVRGDELPGELQFREKRLAKIREAKKALEEAAQLHRPGESHHEDGRRLVRPGVQLPGGGGLGPSDHRRAGGDRRGERQTAGRADVRTDPAESEAQAQAGQRRFGVL